MSQTSWSAKDAQVRVVALTDLLSKTWLSGTKYEQWIRCRGDDSRTSVADKYHTLPKQKICSVQRKMKIMTIIVNTLIIIPTRPRWPARDIGAQKRTMLCNNIIPRNNVSCRHLLRFQCNWSLRSGCQGWKVKVYVRRTKHNPPCILWDGKLWVVQLQSSFRERWRLLTTRKVYIALPQAPHGQQKVCEW
jgi:hypothetical protein